MIPKKICRPEMLKLTHAHTFCRGVEFARDSVILLVSATKMVRMYLFTSSLLRYRGKEAKKA